MIRAGLGISVLFIWNINADLRSGILVAIRTEAPPLELRMALVRRSSAPSTRAVQEFVAMTRVILGQKI
jgi:DNA-binding transcriptional LysR family regulator